MKVRKLIEKLHTFDEELEVKLRNDTEPSDVRAVRCAVLHTTADGRQYTIPDGYPIGTGDYVVEIL